MAAPAVGALVALIAFVLLHSRRVLRLVPKIA
jgi:hypothetical protein